MRDLSLGLIGAGFWGGFQAAAWREVPGARLAALCDANQERAGALAAKTGNPRVYACAETMLREEQLDFVDIATGPETHETLVALAAREKVPVICQKPMALDLETCQRMVAACREAGVPFLVHENFRFRTPFRRVKALLESGRIGRPFRAHLQFSHGGLKFFDRQPYLYTQPHFALYDMGPHLLDLPRYFFGEPDRLTAQECHVNTRFAGPDIVSVMLSYPNLSCHCELSWRTTSYELFLEGTEGTINAYPNGRLIIDDKDGTAVEDLTPQHYAWANPEYGFGHASIVETNCHLLAALRGETPAETTAEDNLRTMQLVFLAIQSAAEHNTLQVP